MHIRRSTNLTIALVLSILGTLVSALPSENASAAGSSYFPGISAVGYGGEIDASEQALAAYPRIGDLFFRLSTASGEAQVVGYNRQMVVPTGATASLEIPAEVSFSADYLESITTSPISDQGERRSFAGTYSVTSIGPSAFRVQTDAGDISAGRTIVYLDEVALPETIKFVGTDAFNGQCAISSVTIPDSVTHIGSWAFGNMSRGYETATSDCENQSGLNTFTLGTSVVDIGVNAFNAATNLTQLRFRGPVFPTRPDDLTVLPSGYELWGTSAAALLGGMEGQNSCSARFSYTADLTLGVIQGNAAGWIAWATTNNCISANSISSIAFTPESPDTPTASSPTAFEATLSFREPDSLGGGAILEYEVLTVQTGTTQSLGASTASPATISGLSPGTTYTLKIRARNSVGWSQFSLQSNPVTTLSVPSGLVAPTASSASTTEISLAFLAPSNLGGAPAVLEYEVMVLPDASTRSLGVSTVSPIIISGLAPNTTYSFKIRARSMAGWSSYSGASNEIMTLAAATGLIAPTASSPTDQSIVLNFEPPSSDGGSPILEYEFTAHPSGATMSLTLNTSSPVVFYGLAPSTDYTFTLRARNGNGWSLESSASNQIRTLPLAGAPAQQTPPAVPAPAQPIPPQATYYGPIPIAITSACISDGMPSLTSLNGLRLSTIYSAEVDGYSITISQVTNTSLTMEIPALPVGIYDVLYRSDFGELNHQQSLRVCAEPTKAPGNAPNSSSASTANSPAAQALVETATVYFSGDSATLTAKAKRILQSLAKSLRGRGKTSVVVEGYVRRTAITSYDRELSQKRASAVIGYLKLMGFKAQFRSIPRGIHPDDSPRARKAVVRATALKS